MTSFNAVIDLLDGHQGYMLQTWQLQEGVVLQIGRGSGADVVIRNPYVSRSHAYIQSTEGRWEVHSLSEGGLIVDGRWTMSVALVPGLEFQLAKKGPILRFRHEVEEEAHNVMATMQITEEMGPLLFLDRRKRDEEVAEFERQSYFAELQSIAQKLRKKRQGTE